MAGRVWTDEERQFIKDNCLTMTCAEMAALLPGRSTRAVQHEFANLGLERPQPKEGDKIERLTIRRRVKLGWEPERAITTPVRKMSF